MFCEVLLIVAFLLAGDVDLPHNQDAVHHHRDHPAVLDRLLSQGIGRPELDHDQLLHKHILHVLRVQRSRVSTPVGTA